MKLKTGSKLLIFNVTTTDEQWLSNHGQSYPWRVKEKQNVCRKNRMKIEEAVEFCKKTKYEEIKNKVKDFILKYYYIAFE